MRKLPRSAIVTPMRLGQNVKTRREALGMTQEALAQEAGVSKGYISLLENGVRKDCTSSVLMRLGIALRVKWWKLAED